LALEELSELDRLVLNILKKNARLSVRKIAASVGVSPATVSRTIRKLEKTGSIKGYVALSDDAEQGYVCSLLILVRVDKDADSEQLAQAISKMDECCLCLLTAGTHDIVSLVACKDPMHANSILKKIRSLGKASSIEASFVTRRFKMMSVPFVDDIAVSSDLAASGLPKAPMPTRSPK
jgi:DNA-binding Lrp family transcriptional regulator